MTPEQCRAARALLGITREQASRDAGCAVKGIYTYENRRCNVADITVEKLQDYFEAVGINFLFNANGIANGIVFGDNQIVPLPEQEQPACPLHFRVARAWLDWTHDKLVEVSGVSLSTLRDFEKERHRPHPGNMTRVEYAIKTFGIRFLFDAERNPIGIWVDVDDDIVDVDDDIAAAA
jgi:transcriptional regulator with XRE-family HTH domain